MIRNILFLFFFFLGIILICVIYVPALALPKFVVLGGGKMMGYWSAICLRIFLSTKIIIKGKENLIKNESFFIAASHQSMFETFFLQTIFNSPIFILKKELLKIPIFGWYLIKIGSISIDRGKTTKENLNFFDKISESVNNANSGDGKESLNVKFDHDLDISFNSRYLIDVASQLDGDKIEIFFKDTGSPALIKDPSDFDSIFVVMPMKG